MGKNNRPKTTETRSISFDAALLTRIDEECDRLRMGRSAFIEDLAMMYFNDPVRLERARMLGATVAVASTAAAPVASAPTAAPKLARKIPFRR